MMRLAHAEFHIITVLDANGFLTRFERRAAARNKIPVRVVRVQALDKEILHVGIGIGEAPSEIRRAPKYRYWHAGQSGAGNIHARCV